MSLRKFSFRGLLKISLIITALIVLLVFVSISNIHVMNNDLSRAEASMRDELTYLSIQLESNQKRAEAFETLDSSSGVMPQKIEAANPEIYRLLTDPIGDIMSGYNLSETGTVVIAADDVIVASDDPRLPVGSSLKQLLGDDLCKAIDTSIQTDRMQAIAYDGVFATSSTEARESIDGKAYLYAIKQGNYIIFEIEPSGMVFSNAVKTTAREVFIFFVTLLILFLVFSRLLNRMVLRPIDDANDALEDIIAGNLESRVKENGTRELVSLASGINTTVDALQGWISEAESRIDIELSAARAIQESALPRNFSSYASNGVPRIFALMDAAKDVGGDFYDFFPLEDRVLGTKRFVFLIADVSGKGIPAALFMMKAITEVRKELQSGVEIGQAIRNASRELANGNNACMFVTMWVGMLDHTSGRIEYVNAGHNPPLLWRKDKGWDWLTQKSGIPLGTPIDFSYTPHSLDCVEGDKILLFTDGVTEAKNSENMMYGEDRLLVSATAHAQEHPQELVTSIREDVATFVQDAEQFDDITILAFETHL